ncbi:hypothetical protein HPB49_015248 [Dermacentor silvarum]|uniref:Uncharacterized protein n=1 Tax=Dermacentor silvarum TaxID=543639 RepID=A0ACB8CYH2_DERSI|nr:hypothetical protein HPB49_015248 [Dermacentor silvarum]
MEADTEPSTNSTPCTTPPPSTPISLDDIPTLFESFAARFEAKLLDAITRINQVYHGVALLGSRIYVVGGCTTGDTYLRTLDSFDTVTGTWEQCESMQVARAFLSVAVLDGHLYAIGGRTGMQRALA